MKKFMLLYSSTANADSYKQNMSKEDMDKMMAPWNAWFEKNASAVVDRGTPLGNGIHMTTEGVPSTWGINGYSIVQTEAMEDLKPMLMDHPYNTMPGGAVEVLEIMSM